MFTNKLKLNPDKTEFIVIGSQKILNNSSLTSLSIFWEIRSHQHKVSGTLEWCSTPISGKVRYRVQFKIGLITYKILNQGPPVYQRELIHPYISSRNTRQSTPKLMFLQTPSFDRRVHKSIKHFSNSFSHYVPVLWNSFPFQVRNSPSVASFRKHLKTNLFNSRFPT